MKITKTFDIQKDGDWIIASVPSVDRDRDRIMPMGIDLNNFKKNPILFFGHNYRDPWAVIGTAREIMLSADSFKILPELRAPASDSDPMHIISALWNQNILRSASIGFIPKKGKPNSFGGTDFEEIELLEVSIVPLPSNQDALRLAIKGLDETFVDVDETARINARALELLKEHLNIEAKRGRVLSAANEKKLIAARDALNDVLAQLEREDVTDDAPNEDRAGIERHLRAHQAQFEEEKIISQDDSKGLDDLDKHDQKEVEPPAFPADAANELSVELRQMVNAISMFTSRKHAADAAGS